MPANLCRETLKNRNHIRPRDYKTLAGSTQLSMKVKLFIENKILKIMIINIFLFKTDVEFIVFKPLGPIPVSLSRTVF